MRFRIISKNFLIIIILDVLLMIAALYTALLIRFEFSVPSYFLATMLDILPFALVFKVASFHFFDMYRGMWRYTSVADLVNIVKAASASSLMIAFFIVFKTRFIGYSRSVIVIDWFLTILFIAGCRLAIRIFFESYKRDSKAEKARPSIYRMFSKGRKNAKKLLIIGAGDCGEKIYREIRHNSALPYHIVGFLDDNRNKIGRKIHGVPVLGSIKNRNCGKKS